MFRQSTDPDFDYLLEHARKTESEPEPARYIIQQLVVLALTKDMADNDDSPKARYLRFCRWMAQGRKDETANFGPASGTGPAPMVSKALLPESTTLHQCAECGKQSGMMSCSGCLIQNGEHKTFATSYCSKTCQAKHWRKHKGLCRQMQQIHRAMSLFQEIFEHLLTLTYPGGHIPKEITEENGMVLMKCDPYPSQRPGQALFRFPHELAPSTDIGRAALTHSRCWEALSRARTLFEMLIRPSCARIQNVLIEPKNMERPVHIAHGEWDEYNALLGHEIILATLSCGMTVVLDPTGIQFGWKDLTSPWSMYKEHRVHRVANAKDLGPNTTGFQDVDSHEVNPFACVFGSDPTEISSRVRKEQLLMETVVLSLQPQIKRRFGGVAEFLRLKEAEFKVARAGVTAAAQRGLTMLAGEINNSAQWKVLSGATTAQGDSGKEIIWFTNRAASNSDDDTRRRVWKARWDSVVDIEAN
ncbi:hypothetical protein C8A00DRAFT_19739 [Chaetomidium leptoderma]|uniref:MYND-type domain-containing protein n=1 Tax=Chaetomidium leptoderma TaxID=669021 RepID=A0AAN6VBN4_9PEZI|nr:hypothetical protein C8A00DRAFT_19739 [Chaetomidium leptoderma]